MATFGPRPGEDGRSALHALLKSKDLYSTSTCAVQTYDPSKFTVTSSGIVAGSLRARLPPGGPRADGRRSPTDLSTSSRMGSTL